MLSVVMLWCGSESIFGHSCDSFQVGLPLAQAGLLLTATGFLLSGIPWPGEELLGPLQKDVLFALFSQDTQAGLEPRQQRSCESLESFPSSSSRCIHCSKQGDSWGVCKQRLHLVLQFVLRVSCPPALLSQVLELGCSASPNYSMESIGNRNKNGVARLSWLRCDLQT